MQIGAVGFQPYIYNTNSVSRSSLNKISALPEDGSESGVDYTAMVDDLADETINPLKRGETSNFADVFAMQMQMSSQNASRVMAPAAMEMGMMM
ncbi:MAG: hypothetical protein PHP50_08490 [Lachnospiraceae bacterium]|nr:hypothetical protein [Lachnospiraceae bacterium]